MADDKLVVVRRITLTAEHRPAGKTRHYHGPDELPPPVLLKVARYTDDDGYYLLYCDASGVEFTDTYHESLEDALAQAEWEFRIQPTEWESLES
jgi:hypothetical protein